MEKFAFLLAGIAVSLLGFVFVAVLYKWILRQPSENAKIAEIGEYIRKGSNTFLWKEYRVLAKFAGVAAVIIFVLLPRPVWASDVNLLDNLAMALAYIFGTVFSGLAGKVGIAVATKANIKTAEASKKGIAPGFLCGFRGGAVMGLAVVGASLLGVSLVFLITGNASMLLGFSF